MKLGFLLTTQLATLAMAGAWAQNPVANPEAVVRVGNARFTVLTPEMIRIEYSDKGNFEDRATFTVQNRRLDVPSFTTREDGDYVYISTNKLKLKYRKGSNPATMPASDRNLSVTMTHDDKPVVWYPGKKDPLNLKGTCRTLDGSNGDNKRAELEDGLISRSGWAVIDDSWSSTRPDGSKSFAMQPDATVGFDWWADRKDPDATDIYFLGYGYDYKKALSDFTDIAGKIPLPPDYVFGYWYSRYASYTDDDYRQIMSELEANEIPTDVMILDMDWHWNGDANSKSEGIGGWTGWSWNTNLIPQPEKLLDEIHDKNFKIALNIHPADGIDSHESPAYYKSMKNELGNKYDDNSSIAWSIDYPDFSKSFFNNVIRDHEREGVDFWWLDWQQHLTSKTTPALGETFWCNHVFFNDMKKNRPNRRPVIFHRWGGLGSHRYQIGFSGDAFINYPTLAFQPYFTSTASNVGYAFWGHDLGGHQISDEKLANDPELMQRWIQFAVFTPIFRSHATKDGRIERRIWKFPNFKNMLESVRLRYSLFPYIYTMARKTYDTGIGMCRPLYYEYPRQEEAYKYENEYFFGDDILVAPVTEASPDGKTSSKEIWFPEGEWYCAETGETIQGPCVKTMDFTVDQTPYFFRAGAMIPLNPPTVMNVTERPERMRLCVVSGAGGSAQLYEDRGDNADYDGSFAMTEFSHSMDGHRETIAVAPRMGDVVGLPSNRRWTMEVVNAPQPRKLRLDGKSLNKKYWNYDKDSRKVTVDVPSASCDKATQLTIDY